jgi:protein phosphatase
MSDIRFISIPNLSLVVLIGASGSGKSTFARKHFKPTEVLSSDFCRALVADDENDLSATEAAFEVLHYVAAKRLAAGRLTVVDATNVQPDARKPLITLARRYHVLPVAIVLDVPEKVCLARNAARTDRTVPPRAIRQHVQQLRRIVGGLEREGFRYVLHLRGDREIDAVQIERYPLWTDQRGEHGPFDIIGDVHGCCDELEELLGRLGYARNESDVFFHPDGRRVVFLGDFVDRGPRIVDALKLVMAMRAAGSALCVPGNHDAKLLRKLRGRNVQITHGLDKTLAELDALPDEERETFKEKVAAFLDSLVSHYVLDDGKLVVAHAGMKEEMQGRASGAVRDFALYGETTGETDEFGLPVRHHWAAEYRGHAIVVYGHTPVPEPEWLNRTINIDTGCVFGGKLTALRYPEKEIVSVPAQKMYAQPLRPFQAQPAPTLTAQQEHDDLLNVADYLKKLIVHTRLMGNVVVREENAAAALEVMTRFAVAPQWLIYLPPTMSPCETSRRADFLEHPEDAFAYFRHEGVPRVVCEEKHMGSRVVIVLCRDEEVARKRFGIVSDDAIRNTQHAARIGVCYTRTGRPFFNDENMERVLLERLRAACDACNFWETHGTDWLCLDAELMPWSAKAQELLRQQYAPVGVAGGVALAQAEGILAQAARRGLDVSALQSQTTARREAVNRYRAAYRQYCWDVSSIDDLKLAPFHLLATEGKVHVDRDHAWHVETLKALCDAADCHSERSGESQANGEMLRCAQNDKGGVLCGTSYRIVDVMDEASQREAIAWWETLTANGGEGMVVKPYDFIVRGARGLVQPAVKCRGREYLRIIYGPEYLLPENLERLRARGLSAKRMLALREFALGVEALERFVRREPLRRVHECVFGVLALESEPVDPRL